MAKFIKIITEENAEYFINPDHIVSIEMWPESNSFVVNDDSGDYYACLMATNTEFLATIKQ